MTARAAYLRRLDDRIDNYLRRKQEETVPDPSTPYSEATVELVADAVARAVLEGRIGGTRRHARYVLDGLAAAGRLLPEGAEIRTQYGVRLEGAGGEQSDWRCDDRADAEQRAATHRDMCELRPDWPVTPSLIHRPSILWAGPWSPVPPEPKEGTPDA